MRLLGEVLPVVVCWGELAQPTITAGIMHRGSRLCKNFRIRKIKSLINIAPILMQNSAQITRNLQ